jgi:hypothetical protein
LATSDATSAQTLGLITADIANNANGFVTIIGLVANLNTSAYTDGAQLYLSPITAGDLTATKPYAPQHLVYMAVVAHAHPTQGKLLVKVQNGYELDELHNVSAQSPTTGQTIVWNSATSLWEKNTVSLTVGVNGTLPVLNGGTGVTTSTGTGSVVLSTSPTLVTPALGTPSALVGTNITGTAANFNINGTVGATTPATGAFTTLSASGTTTLSGNQIISVTDNTNAALRVTQLGTGNSILVEDSTNPDSTPFVVDASGNTGIGTSSPTAKLHVVGNSLVSSYLDVTTNTGAGFGLRIRADSVDTYSGIQFTNNAVSAQWAKLVSPSANTTAFQDGGANELMRINITGLGIGTASPVAKLDVAGDYKEGVVTANTTTAYTISLASGTLQILTLTGNCTYTFPTPVAGKSFILVQKQDATGGRTVTWPASVDWPSATAPTLTATALRADKFVFTAIDGSNWLGSVAGQNYTV